MPSPSTTVNFASTVRRWLPSSRSAASPPQETFAQFPSPIVVTPLFTPRLISSSASTTFRLPPSSFLSDDSTYIFDGSPKSKPAAALQVGVLGDSYVAVILNNDKSVRAGFVKDLVSGVITELVEFAPGVLAAYESDALDQELLKLFDLADLPVPGSDDRRGLRGLSNLRKLSAATDFTQNTEVCGSNLREFDLALAIDSSYCQRYGGETGVNDQVDLLLSYMATYLDDNRLCFILANKVRSVQCSGGSYAGIINTATTICGGSARSDLLNDFRIEEGPGLSSALGATMLIFDDAGPNANFGSTIGCAYVGATCNNSYKYGVNWAKSSSPLIRTILLTHELGHILGSNHDSSGGFIMRPSIDTNAKSFSTQSRAAISLHTASKSCLTAIETDQCPDDPDKIAPGDCGCGVADTDSDGDGTADCIDTCPNDPDKVSSGICGCGVADNDLDLDGVVDCNDGCPSDPLKTEPGIYGCGVADDDLDLDLDGVVDCNDTCPGTP